MTQKKIRIPRKVKIGGAYYSVLTVPRFEDEDNLLGLACVEDNKIYITESFSGVKRSPQKIVETLIHECAHIVEFEWAIKDMEHTMLEQICLGLYQVLLDNNIDLASTNIPKTVKIGGFTYKILFPYTQITSEQGSFYSLFDTEEMVFKISGTAKSKVFIKQSFFKILICAIADVYCSDEAYLNEANDMLLAFSRGMYQFIVDNGIEQLVKDSKV